MARRARPFAREFQPAEFCPLVITHHPCRPAVRVRQVWMKVVSFVFDFGRKVLFLGRVPWDFFFRTGIGNARKYLEAPGGSAVLLFIKNRHHQSSGFRRHQIACDVLRCSGRFICRDPAICCHSERTAIVAHPSHSFFWCPCRLDLSTAFLCLVR